MILCDLRQKTLSSPYLWSLADGLFGHCARLQEMQQLLTRQCKQFELWPNFLKQIAKLTPFSLPQIRNAPVLPRRFNLVNTRGLSGRRILPCGVKAESSYKWLPFCYVVHLTVGWGQVNPFDEFSKLHPMTQCYKCKVEFGNNKALSFG